MPIGVIMSILPMIFRVLHEAPALLADIEAFWAKVAPPGTAPPHVEAAVQAAFVKLHDGEVG